MKKLQILIFLIASVAMFGQENKETRKFDGPKELWIDGEMKIYLHRADETHIDIETKKVDPEFVYTKLKNEELLIRVEPIDIEGGEVIIHAYLPELSKLIVTRAARVIPDKNVLAQQAEIKLKAGADLSIEADLQRITASVASGSFLEVKGKLDTLDALIKSGARLRTKDIELNHAIVWARTGGFAAITPIKSADCHACFGGDIKLLTSPKKKKFKDHFGGSITIEKTK